MRKAWMIRPNARARRWGRRGAAVVEMAVVMPLLVTLLFGIMEFGHRFMVYQTLIQAAREGCRTAVLGVTDTEVRTRVADYMTAAGLPNYQVTLTHATDSDHPNEVVTVTVNKADVTLLGNFFGPSMSQGEMSSTCTMRTEKTLS